MEALQLYIIIVFVCVYVRACVCVYVRACVCVCVHSWPVIYSGLLKTG